MKKTNLAIIFLIIFIQLHAQQKQFEGSIVYNVVVKSKTTDVDDHFYKLLLAGNGNKMTVYIKDGNYKQSIGISDTYYIYKAKRIYIKFRNIDTLYYRDYASDTTSVTGIIKSDSVSIVNNFKCHSILIKRDKYNTRYLYTDSLHLNTEYDQDNTVENLNVFSRETNGSVWLYCTTEYNTALITDSCTHLEQKKIDLHLFDLPALPQKNILASTLFIPARFPGKEKAWDTYLKNNLNGSLAIKYLKLPKGQDTLSQKVIVSFVVAENGNISNIRVKNKEEVNAKLAEEAMRVIRESPVWMPATLYGEKIKFTANQPVVFAIAK